MLTPVASTRFKRDTKLSERRGQPMDKLRLVVSLLIAEQPLPAEYRDHALIGDWGGFRDLHIEPDWILIYRVEGQKLRLARTGTHADLFKK